MLTNAQVRHLRELHDTLATRPDVGPVEPPQVGSQYWCGRGRPTWLFDTTTNELAVQMATKADHHYACRFRILGIRWGHPRMNPLRNHYGLTDAQITRMAEIDLQYLPDAQHRGRDVWLQRQQEHIALAIRAGTPEPPATATTRDPLLVLTAIEPTRQRELIEKTQPMATSVS